MLPARTCCFACNIFPLFGGHGLEAALPTNLAPFFPDLCHVLRKNK